MPFNLFNTRLAVRVTAPAYETLSPVRLLSPKANALREKNGSSGSPVTSAAGRGNKSILPALGWGLHNKASSCEISMTSQMAFPTSRTCKALWVLQKSADSTSWIRRWKDWECSLPFETSAPLASLGSSLHWEAASSLCPVLPWISHASSWALMTSSSKAWAVKLCCNASSSASLCLFLLIASKPSCLLPWASPSCHSSAARFKDLLCWKEVDDILSLSLGRCSIVLSREGLQGEPISLTCLPSAILLCSPSLDRCLFLFGHPRSLPWQHLWSLNPSLSFSSQNRRCLLLVHHWVWPERCASVPPLELVWLLLNPPPHLWGSFGQIWPTRVVCPPSSGFLRRHSPTPWDVEKGCRT